MDENQDLELELDAVETNVENRLKAKNRFEQLSEKVILTAREKEEALKRASTEEQARIGVEKERDFYKSFSSNVAKYPEAAAYQDQILEKVKAGYDTEDAMIAILAREGKYGNVQQPDQQAHQAPVHAEGGSAPTTFEGTPSLDRMSTDDKFAALSELDKDGALSAALRGR